MTEETKLELYPFQETGVEFLANRRRAFLADEMGLGKTVQALRAADTVGAQRIVVVCPASVRSVWYGESEVWSLLDPDLRVYSYTELLQGRRLVDAIQFSPEVLILDEAHYLKTPTAKRTRAVYGRLARAADRIWALSGTPAPNGWASEIWTHCRALGGEELEYRPFCERYCYTGHSDYSEFRVFSNRKDTAPELIRKMEPWYLRRTVKSVGLDLPPVRWGTMHMDVQDVFLSELPDEERHRARELNTVLRAAEGQEEAEELLEELAPHLPTLRRLTGEAKASAVISELQRELDEGLESVVVFCYHRSVMEMLERAWPDAAVIHGGTPAAQRGEEVRRFQAGETSVFLGQIQAAGEGITLTRASHVVFVEPDWSPSAMAQAAKRVHRIGQEHPVLIRVAALRGSLDGAVVRVVSRKAQDAETILRVTEETPT